MLKVGDLRLFIFSNRKILCDNLFCRKKNMVFTQIRQRYKIYDISSYFLWFLIKICAISTTIGLIIIICWLLLNYYFITKTLHWLQFNKPFRTWFLQYFCKEGDLGEKFVSHMGDFLKVGDWPKKPKRGIQTLSGN